MGKKLKIEKAKKKEKLHFFKTATGDFEKELFKGPRIELFSNKEMMLEGCLGVLEYNENYLKLRLSSGALVLEGEDFDVVSFFDESIFVKGKINSLEFAV